uniref:Uncharacterized protein n=1 Tax=Knipowitschia caucasica TaxID=637954 RepID=A0AAV2KB00_KNICA
MKWRFDNSPTELNYMHVCSAVVTPNEASITAVSDSGPGFTLQLHYPSSPSPQAPLPGPIPHQRFAAPDTFIDWKTPAQTQELSKSINGWRVMVLNAVPALPHRQMKLEFGRYTAGKISRKQNPKFPDTKGIKE